MTSPELRLWAILRGKGLSGLRFRRQHPIGSYILDFYCPAAHLAIEVDGQGHGHPEQAAHDARRDKWLTDRGVTVLRVLATDVRDNADGVIIAIVAAASGATRAG